MVAQHELNIDRLVVNLRGFDDIAQEKLPEPSRAGLTAMSDQETERAYYGLLQVSDLDLRLKGRARGGAAARRRPGAHRDSLRERSRALLRRAL